MNRNKPNYLTLNIDTAIIRVVNCLAKIDIICSYFDVNIPGTKLSLLSLNPNLLISISLDPDVADIHFQTLNSSVKCQVSRFVTVRTRKL